MPVFSNLRCILLVIPPSCPFSKEPRCFPTYCHNNSKSGVRRMDSGQTKIILWDLWLNRVWSWPYSCSNPRPYTHTTPALWFYNLRSIALLRLPTEIDAIWAIHSSWTADWTLHIQQKYWADSHPGFHWPSLSDTHHQMRSFSTSCSPPPQTHHWKENIAGFHITFSSARAYLCSEAWVLFHGYKILGSLEQHSYLF